MVSPGGGLVHLVDDEQAIRRSLDFLLRASGYSVKHWASGEAFLAGADAAMPACVLLDMHMPGIDGIAVLQRLAARGSDWPVVIMSGDGNMAQCLQAIMAGAAHFLEKPFPRDRVLLAVEAAFARIGGGLSARDERSAACRQIAGLAEGERTVLDGLACGHLNQTIAEDLGLSLQAVEIHRAHCITRLDADSLADALRIAINAGLGDAARWARSHGVALPLPL